MIEEIKTIVFNTIHRKMIFISVKNINYRKWISILLPIESDIIEKKLKELIQKEAEKLSHIAEMSKKEFE